MQLSPIAAASIKPRELRGVLYKPENKYLSSTTSVPEKYGYVTNVLDYQCKFIAPAEAEIKETFDSYIDVKYRGVVPASDAKELVHEAITSLHFFWHNFMLTFMRGSLKDLEARLKLALGEASPADVKSELIMWGFTRYYVENYVLKQKMPQPDTKRYKWPSQHELIRALTSSDGEDT